MPAFESQWYLLLLSMNQTIFNEEQRVKGEIEEWDGLDSWQSKGNSKLSERVAIPSCTRRMEAAGQ